MLKRTRAAVLLSFAALIAPTPARADWPMARHDARRTAAAPGKSDIKQPEIAWSTFLGGSIRSKEMMVLDLDGDGTNEIVYVTSGAITAKRADDSFFWKKHRTHTFGLATLLGAEDLDGDGVKEIIVYTTRRAFAIDRLTGDIRWASPEGAIGKLGYIRLGDVTGDGRPDLIVGDCGGCGGGLDQSGFIYSFPSGYGNPITTTMAHTPGGPGVALALADMVGSGHAQILLNESATTLMLIDGNTGAKLAGSKSLGGQMAWSTTCMPAELDGTPGAEAICVASDSPVPAPALLDNRQVFALKLSMGALASLDFLWTYSVPPDEALSNDGYDPLIDLDGNGTNEVVVSGRHADGSFTMHVLDAATGAEVAKLDGQRFLSGRAKLTAGTQPALLTFANSTTSAWLFKPKANPKFELLWTLADRGPRQQPDWSRVAISAAANFRAVTVDLDGDGVDDVVMQKLSFPNDLYAYATLGNTAKPLGSLGAPLGSTLGAAWAVPPVNRPYPQLAVATTEGVLHMLDRPLVFTEGAVRVGGYYAPGAWSQLGSTPVIASLDGSPAEQVIATDSRGALIRLDASKAGKNTPPVTVWTAPGTTAPTLAKPPGGGPPTLAAIASVPQSDPPKFEVHWLGVDTGQVLASWPLPGRPFNDLVPADLDNDGHPDFAVQTAGSAFHLLVTQGVSSATGKALWSSTADLAPYGAQPSGISAADWDGDGIDDIVHEALGVRVMSGKDGSEIAASDALKTVYFLPTLTDTNNDGALDIVLNGGAAPASVIGHDMSALYLGVDDDQPFPYGAIAVCDMAQVLVEGSWRVPPRLKITMLSPVTIGKSVSMVLAEGKKYADFATAMAAGVGMGQLTSATVHANLTGDGHPSVLVGSTDGWLYAVNPCTGELDFSIDFQSAVGEPIFGDTDGDGRDEILVTVADGFLYDLRNFVPTPGGSGGASNVSSASSGSSSSSSRAGGSRGYLDARLYGRAGCFCATPPGSGRDLPPMSLAALGLAAAAGLARRRRGP